MILKIIVGQRECAYEGQYAMEVLDVADEYLMDENPTWLPNRLKQYKQDASFEAVKIFTLKLPKGTYERIHTMLMEKHILDITSLEILDK